VNGTLQSEVQVGVLASQAYYVQLGGYGGATGSFVLRASVAPPRNDAFESATMLALPAVIAGPTHGATVSTSEPIPCAGIGSTVWYRLRPVANGTLAATTAGSNFDTVLAIYENSLSNLRGCNDDANGTLQSQLNIPVTAGSTYFVQLGGYNARIGDAVLQVSLGAATASFSGAALGTTIQQVDKARLEQQATLTVAPTLVTVESVKSLPDKQVSPSRTKLQRPGASPAPMHRPDRSVVREVGLMP
jgi:hypothetical protein